MARPEKDPAILRAIEAARQALEAAQGMTAAPSGGCACGQGFGDVARPCAYHATAWNELQAALDKAARAARSIEAGP